MYQEDIIIRSIGIGSRYRNMQEKSHVIRVLFVCLGNICRSPLAQGIFEHEIRHRSLSHKFVADSAGTSGWHNGESPHHSSIQIARQYQTDISKQKSRPVSFGDLKSFDYFIPMDSNNKHSLLHDFAFDEKKVIKIRHFDPLNKDSDVPDPYGQGMSSFDEVYQMLATCMNPFINFLLEQNLEKNSQ